MCILGEKMFKYRIYVYRGFDYELEKVTKNESDIEAYINRENKDYTKLLVIRHDIRQNMDIPYIVEYFDNVNRNKPSNDKVKRKGEKKK